MNKYAVYFKNSAKAPDYVDANDMMANHGLLTFNVNGSTVAVYSMEDVLKAVLVQKGELNPPSWDVC